MMRLRRHLPLAVWAARDIQRRWGRASLLFACLAGIAFTTAAILLFSQALETTWGRLMQATPNLVIRRIDAGGWAPLPIDEALACAGTVPGVLNPTARIWGVAAGPEGPVTVVASAAALPADRLGGIKPPSPGRAVVGQGVSRSPPGSRLELNARDGLSVEIVDTFPAATGLVTHDLVWITPDDARQLLGLAPSQASDLAVYLFREDSEQAIQADLVAAFPWPVHIADRNTSLLRYHARANRSGGLALLIGLPALLGLLLVISATAVDTMGRQAHWGLLQSMGWTAADLVRLQVSQAVMVGLPAVTLGLALAYTAVFYPPASGVIALWITGGPHIPTLILERSGAVLIMLQIAALVGLPYLAAVFLTTLRTADSSRCSLLEAVPWN